MTFERLFNAGDCGKSQFSGKEIAKTVMIKIDGKMAMAVLLASLIIDFDSLKEISGTGNVSLAIEHEFKNRFPDCELGAMPPFGNLYDILRFKESRQAAKA